MSEEMNTTAPAMPSVPSDIYTPLDPMDNETETISAGDNEEGDRDIERPHLNAEVDPDSPQAYDTGNDESDENDAASTGQASDDKTSDRPAAQTPGNHAFDRGFEYDDGPR